VNLIRSVGIFIVLINSGFISAELISIQDEELASIGGQAGLSIDVGLDFPDLKFEYQDTEDSADNNLFILGAGLKAKINDIYVDIVDGGGGIGMLSVGLPKSIVFDNTVLTLSTQLDPLATIPIEISSQISAQQVMNYQVQLTTANNPANRVRTGCIGPVIGGTCIGIPIYGLDTNSNFDYQSATSVTGINSNLYEITNPSGGHELAYSFTDNLPESTVTFDLRVDKKADFRFILEALTTCSDSSLFGGAFPNCDSADPRIIIRDSNGNIVANGDINNLTGLAEDGIISLGSEWVEFSASTEILRATLDGNFSFGGSVQVFGR